MSGNTLGTDAAKVIAKVLENRPELERCLWADMFTGRLRKEIPPSLIAFGDAIIKAKAHLVEIDLSDNAFGPIGIESIERLLMDEACYTLEVIFLQPISLSLLLLVVIVWRLHTRILDI